MRVRTEHWALLLSICEKNPELITNRFNGPEGRSKGHILWQNVAQQLNSLGFGEKTKEDWRKAFVDWRSKTKAKASKQRQEMEKTGGGPANHYPLSDLEKRLLHLMGTRAVKGNNVPEMGFEQVTIRTNPIILTESRDVLDQEIRSNYQVDHDHQYEANNQTHSTKHAHQQSGASALKRKRRVVRESLIERNSKRILEMSEKSLQLLTRINENTSSIAESLKIIASAMPKCEKKHI